MDELKLSRKTIQIIVNLLVEPLVTQLTPLVEQYVDKRLNHDEILNKGELAERLFGSKSKYKAIDSIMYLPGFPTMPKTADSKDTRFSLRAVEKWIADNQQYRN